MPPYTIPVPPTFVSGPVRAPLLRASVSDAIALLSRPPLFSGAQTITSQSIPNNTYTPVQIDTEYADNLSGHQPGSSATNPYYYGMFPGWYLCETAIPISTSASGTTALGASIGGIQNGGSDTTYPGGIIPAVSGGVYMAAAAKLMKMQQTGTYGSGDYMYATVTQSNGGSSSEPLTNSGSNYPYLSCRWVSALTGTSGLPVPANPAWPAPASYITSAFANTNIRDTIRFLIYPPVMEYSAASGSLASSASLPATGTTVSLTTATVDNYTAYTSGVWTAPVAGEYYLYGCVAISTGASAVTLATGFTVTSSNYNSGTTFTIWGGCGTSLTSGTAAQAARKRLRLNAGDTVSLAAAQNDSGSASATYSSLGPPRLIIIWQGA